MTSAHSALRVSGVKELPQLCGFYVQYIKFGQRVSINGGNVADVISVWSLVWVRQVRLLP